MAYVQVARIPRPGVFARVADAGLIVTILAVPFVILAVGAPLALAIWGLLQLLERLV